MKRQAFLHWRMAQSALLVTLAIGFPSLSLAHELKVGVVDVERVVVEADSVQTAIQVGRAQLREKQEVLEAKVRERERLGAKLEAQRSVLAEGTIKAEQAKIQALEKEIGSLAEEVNKDLARVRDEVVGPQRKRILETVKEVGQREGFDLIVRSEMVLFMGDVTDVTLLVIQALEASSANDGEQKSPQALLLKEPEK